MFGEARPATVVVTTPNAEYNALFPNLAAGAFRHPDHRFEWTRAAVSSVGREDRIDLRLPAGVHRHRPTGRGARRADADGGVHPMSAADKNIEIPDFSLVVLIGVDGFGQIDLRGEAFPADRGDLVGLLPRVSFPTTRPIKASPPTPSIWCAKSPAKRLKHRKLAVIDATNVRPADRKGWIELARRWHALPVAIVFDPGIDVCIERNRARPDRAFGGQVVQRMVSEVRRGLGGLQREGFRQVWKLTSVESIEAATVTRQPLWTDKRNDAGPFDIIGDVHGCADELQALLTKLGYRIEWGDDRGDRAVTVMPPAGPQGRSSSAISSTADRTRRMSCASR